MEQPSTKQPNFTKERQHALAAKEKEISELKEKMERHATTTSNLTQQVSTLSKEKTDLQEQLTKFTKEHQRALAAKEKEISELKEEMNQHTTTTSNLAQQIATLSKDKNDLQERLTNLKARADMQTKTIQQQCHQLKKWRKWNSFSPAEILPPAPTPFRPHYKYDPEGLNGVCFLRDQLRECLDSSGAELTWPGTGIAMEIPRYHQYV